MSLQLAIPEGGFKKIGNYRILDILGKGGMGTVYLCEQPTIGSKVAIKVLLPEHVDSPWVVDRFLGEARAVNSIEHPGIVRIHDADYQEGVGLYMVMEYLEGANLKEAYRDRLPISDREMARIVLQVASALAACHAQGIVHRDITSSNVFLTPDPDMPAGQRVKVLDFGVAKLLDHQRPKQMQTVAGMVMGSPRYMSPEQSLDSGTVDERSDIYSLGVIAFNLVTGRFPAEATTLGQLILRRMNAPATPARHYNPELRPELEAVLARALRRAPEDRFQTMEAFREGLCEVVFQQQEGLTMWARRISKPIPDPEAAPRPAQDTEQLVAALRPVLTGELPGAGLDSEQDLTNALMHPDHAATIVDLQPPASVAALIAAPTPTPAPTPGPIAASPAPAPKPRPPAPAAQGPTPGPMKMLRTPPDPPWTAELHASPAGPGGQALASPSPPRRWVRNLALVGVGAALVAAALLWGPLGF